LLTRPTKITFGEMREMGVRGGWCFAYAHFCTFVAGTESG
jgi:hypothetical protein